MKKWLVIILTLSLGLSAYSAKRFDKMKRSDIVAELEDIPAKDTTTLVVTGSDLSTINGTYSQSGEWYLSTTSSMVINSNASRGAWVIYDLASQSPVPLLAIADTYGVTGVYSASGVSGSTADPTVSYAAWVDPSIGTGNLSSNDVGSAAFSSTNAIIAEAVSQAGETAPPFDILTFYGDSNTVGYNATSFVWFVEDRLPAGITITNTAQGGWQTSDLLGSYSIRVTPHYDASKNCALFFMAGVNDFGIGGRTAAQAWVDYKAIIDTALAEGWEVYCITYYGWPSYNTQLEDLNAEIFNYSIGRYTVIDGHSWLMDDSDGDVQAALIQGDSHLNDDGQKKLSELVYKMCMGGARETLPARSRKNNGLEITSDSLVVGGSTVITEATITEAQELYRVSEYERDEVVSFDRALSTNLYSISSVDDIGWTGDIEYGAALYTTNGVGSVYYTGAEYKAPWGKTFSFSYNLTATPNAQRFFAGHRTPTGGTAEAIVIRESTGLLTFTVNNGASYESFSFDAANPIGSWNYVTISIASDFSEVRVCQNGVIHTIVPTVGTPTPTDNFSFGFPIGYSETASVEGFFDNITWYDRELSNIEMQRLQTQQSFGFVD